MRILTKRNCQVICRPVGPTPVFLVFCLCGDMIGYWGRSQCKLSSQQLCYSYEASIATRSPLFHFQCSSFSWSFCGLRPAEHVFFNCFGRFFSSRLNSPSKHNNQTSPNQTANYYSMIFLRLPKIWQYRMFYVCSELLFVILVSFLLPRKH